jgi:hypothetical protein
MPSIAYSAFAEIDQVGRRTGRQRHLVQDAVGANVH